MECIPPFLLIGASHRTAPVDIRAQLAAVMPSVTSMQSSALHANVLLSTCNRVELYVATHNTSEALTAIEQKLASLLGDLFPRIRACLYIVEGRDVATHLLRVAAGLDSIVLGENQILGQVARALADATATGKTDAFLDRLFRSAIRTGKRTHSETTVGKSPTSISHVAVKLLQQRLGHLRGKKILIIGAGKMARLTAQVFGKHDAVEVAFINRTAGKAESLASEFSCRRFAWDNFRQALAWADVVIAATASPEPVLHVSELSERLAAADSRPLSIVDMAAPRNVEHGVEDLPGVRYAGVDDLGSTLDENLEKRRAVVPEVEAVVREEVEAYMTWCHHRHVVPLITDLRRKVERVADAELERVFGALGHLDLEQRLAITRAVHRITGKLLHEPTVRLKSPEAAVHGYHHAVRHLFALSETEAAGSNV